MRAIIDDRGPQLEDVLMDGGGERVIVGEDEGDARGYHIFSRGNVFMTIISVVNIQDTLTRLLVM